MQIAVGGCLAQKDGEAIRARAPYVDVVFGTHNLRSAPVLLRRAAAEGPVVEVLDAPADSESSWAGSALAAVRDLAHSAWVTIQVGCDNSCAFCVVPHVRGPEGEQTHGRSSVRGPVPGIERGDRGATPLGQNVNSYGRDSDPPGTAVPRRARCGPWARWTGSGECASPARIPSDSAARDHRGHGRDRGGVRAPSPASAVGKQQSALRHAPRIPGRALSRTAARRGGAPPVPIWLSPPTSSWASQGRPKRATSSEQ